MALDLSTIRKDLEDGIKKATSVADVADHFAKVAAQYSALIPTLGPEVKQVAGLIDDGDKLLHSLDSALGV